LRGRYQERKRERERGGNAVNSANACIKTENYAVYACVCLYIETDKKKRERERERENKHCMRERETFYVCARERKNYKRLILGMCERETRESEREACERGIDGGKERRERDG